MNPDPAYASLFTLPLAERLQLVEDLWDSIAAERAHEPVSTQVLSVLQDRKARHDANPSAAIPWEQAKRRLRDAG